MRVVLHPGSFMVIKVPVMTPNGIGTSFHYVYIGLHWLVYNYKVCQSALM